MIFVALLHAVNLGARRKVPMADLRALLTGLGLEDVRTYIQSGNAVFSAAPETDLRGRLEAALEAQFGFPVPVTLRTAHEWQEAARGCPAHLRDEPVVLAFLRDPPDPARVAALRGRDVIRIPFVSLTDRKITDLPTPRPEPVVLLLAPLGLKVFANLSTGVRMTPERWEVVGQTLYQTVPDGVRTLNLSSGVLERTLGVKVTVRNERTVQAIAAMLDT
ncbi:hypothetical protein DEIGR_100791 [Deinococcus grandis]|uniref:DUF1697 domain-containing protein n=1 Tax=Deinococcus grandis TaxID=57498 RepID=A0A100HJY5_9DEIO|nr:DUF1697 domain-containing protein [Deinococcus grandis]BBN95750.1 hypothetical protein DEGR_24830 [Deinococcus grandis]GAQ20764.1 hypothetical protein DEIGR_100791 [Deinococcus grandis]